MYRNNVAKLSVSVRFSNSMIEAPHLGRQGAFIVPEMATLRLVTGYVAAQYFLYFSISSPGKKPCACSGVSPLPYVATCCLSCSPFTPAPMPM